FREIVRSVHIVGSEKKPDQIFALIAGTGPVFPKAGFFSRELDIKAFARLAINITDNGISAAAVDNRTGKHPLDKFTRTDGHRIADSMRGKRGLLLPLRPSIVEVDHLPRHYILVL